MIILSFGRPTLVPSTGGIGAASNKQALYQAGITAVVCASAVVPAYFPGEFAYHSVAVYDEANQDILSHIPASNAFIQQVVAGGITVMLLHSTATHPAQVQPSVITTGAQCRWRGTRTLLCRAESFGCFCNGIHDGCAGIQPRCSMAANQSSTRHRPSQSRLCDAIAHICPPMRCIRHIACRAESMTCVMLQILVF